MKAEQPAFPHSSRKSWLWNEAISPDWTQWLVGNKLGQRLHVGDVQPGFSGRLHIA